MNGSGIAQMPPFDQHSHLLNAVIETPKGCRNKFKFSPVEGTFQLRFVLPAGNVFPYDFGFIPGTRGDDGDPLDVLVLMDCPAFPGCIIPSRLIGVIEAKQTENRKTERNDRFIAVAEQSREMRSVESLKDIDRRLLKELEHFFVSYNEMRGKRFSPMGNHGPKRAKELLGKGVSEFNAHDSV